MHAKSGFFGWFNRAFDRGAGRYQRVVEFLLRRRVRGMIGYAVAGGGAGRCSSRRLPTGFLPEEDQGLMYAQVVLPPGARWRRRTQALATGLQPSPHRGEGRGRVGHVRRRLQLRRARARTPGIGFVRLRTWDERKRDAAARRRGGRARQKAFAGDQGGHRLRLRAAGGHRARQRHRLRPPARRTAAASATTRSWRRATSCSAWPARTRASPRCAPTAWRTRRSSTSTSTRRRPARWALARRHQRDAGRGLGRRLRQRLHRPRARQARLHAGRRAVPHAAGGPRPLVRAQRAGEMVPFSAFATGRWTFGLAEAGALQRRPVRRDPGRARARPQLGRGDGGDGADRRAAARPASASSGPASPTRSGSRAPTRRRSTPSRCWSCSCAWRRSTRAGRSRSR